MSRKATIDLITQRPDGTFCLRIVEEGPWLSIDDVGLKKIQERLFDAAEIITDGHLAAKFPESKDKKACIRLDCYDLPVAPLDSFFARFEEFVRSSPEWSARCATITFEIVHRTLKEPIQPPQTTTGSSAPSRV